MTDHAFSGLLETEGRSAGDTGPALHPGETPWLLVIEASGIRRQSNFPEGAAAREEADPKSLLAGSTLGGLFRQKPGVGESRQARVWEKGRGVRVAARRGRVASGPSLRGPCADGVGFGGREGCAPTDRHMYQRYRCPAKAPKAFTAPPPLLQAPGCSSYAHSSTGLALLLSTPAN